MREQVLAANIDVAFLVQALPLDFNVRRLERYLAMAWESGAQPVVLLTKTDLVDDVAPYLDQVEAVTLGACPTHAVSAKTGEGIDELRAVARAEPHRSAARLVRCRQVDDRERARGRGDARDAGGPRGRPPRPPHHLAPRADRARRRRRRSSTRRASASCSSGTPTSSRRSATSRRSRAAAASPTATTTRSPAARSARRSRTARCSRRALAELRQAAARARGDRGPAEPPTATGTRPGVQDPRTSEPTQEEALSPPRVREDAVELAAARSRAPLRRGRARPGARAAAARPALRLGRRRLAARLPAPRGRPASSTCSASTATSRPTRRTRGARRGPFGDKSVIEWPEYAAARLARLDRRRRARSSTSRSAAAGSSRACRCCSTRRPSRRAPTRRSSSRTTGPSTREYSGLTRFLDAMSWEERIPPLRAALIQPVDRNETYSASALYAAALVRELLPAIAKRAPHGSRIGMGASLGALAMLHAHRRHPKLVRRAAAPVGQLLPPALGQVRVELPSLPAHHAVRRHRPTRRRRRARRSPSRSPAAPPRRTARTTRRSPRRCSSRDTRPGSRSSATRTTGRAGATPSTRTCPR